jgi:hypothetical protein
VVACAGYFNRYAKVMEKKMSLPEEIAKLIPGEQVYRDAAQPALQQIGKSLEKVIKAARFLLAPLEYLAAQHDRWEKYLERISKNVEKENMVEGHPQIVIPSLEGLSFCQENSLIAEMFVNLLSKTIDKTKLDLAHPAFAKIIQQLSSDEAVILYYLKKNSYELKEQSDFDHSKHLFFNRRTIFEEFPAQSLSFPNNLWMYMDHLYSLNLAGTWQIGNQEPIIDQTTKDQTGIYINSERCLTPFGQLFCKACVPDEFPGI